MGCISLYLIPRLFLQSRTCMSYLPSVHLPVQQQQRCLQNSSLTSVRHIQVIRRSQNVLSEGLSMANAFQRIPTSESKITSGQRYRGITHYVAGMRHLQDLKEKDDACEQAMRSGLYAVFYDLRASVCTDEDSKRLKLVWRTAEEMESVFELSGGLTYSDAVLLNSACQDPQRPAKFALNIPKCDESTQRALQSLLQAETIGIRRALFGVSRTEIADLVQGYSLLQWHSLQAFCSKCGSKNQKNMSGSRRSCSTCSETYYPTMKPIVITLVVDGERCLVARQPQFPDGMYSALAGFCDMGETLEDTVRREVAEEVGLEVDGITYSSSQHWPLPISGLMLGCYATIKSYSNNEILIDNAELEDAKWLTKEEVQAVLEAKGQSSLWLPPRQAIAHRLIRGWAYRDESM